VSADVLIRLLEAWGSGKRMGDRRLLN